MTAHVHGIDPDRCDRCWDVVIDTQAAVEQWLAARIEEDA